MSNVKELVKYLVPIKTYTFKQQPKKLYVSKYEQDSSNCWLYSGLNNLYSNLGLEPDIVKIKAEIESNGQNAQIGGQRFIGQIFIAKQYKDLVCYQVDIVKQINIFTKLLKAGFVFSISRRHNDDLLEDIKDDHIVQNVIKAEAGHHAINIYRDGKYIVELGNRGKSKYNKFQYTLASFLGSVKQGTIRSDIYFLFYKND